jgi:hypothetical protein
VSSPPPALTAPGCGCALESLRDSSRAGAVDRDSAVSEEEVQVRVPIGAGGMGEGYLARGAYQYFAMGNVHRALEQCAEGCTARERG